MLARFMLFCLVKIKSMSKVSGGFAMKHAIAKALKSKLSNELFPERKEVKAMPGFDGTGPAGSGPMTGGGRGYCSPAGSYNFGRPWLRHGVGFGDGRGRGYRHIFWETGLPRWGRGDPSMGGPYSRPVVSKKSEIAVLKDEAEALKESLNAIQERINDLEGEQEPNE
jgi:hypothetical protein